MYFAPLACRVHAYHLADKAAIDRFYRYEANATPALRFQVANRGSSRAILLPP